MKTRELTVVAALVAGAVCFAAIAQDEPPRGPEGQDGPEGGPAMAEGMGGIHEGLIAKILEKQRLAKEIGLNDEQVKKLRDGIFELRKQGAQLKADQEIAGIEQARLMSEDTIDEKAVMSAVDKKYQVMTELAKLRIKQMIMLKQTLSPEQAEKLRALMRERMNQRKREGEQGRKRGAREASERRGWFGGRERGERQGPQGQMRGGPGPMQPMERGPAGEPGPRD